MSETGPIVVLGSAVVDQSYRVDHLPLPGESAIARDVRRSLGGKGANQAAAARHLDAPVAFIGCVGDDDEGREMQADLEGRGIQALLRVVPGVPTGHAAVLVDDQGENQLAVHLGANAEVGLEDVERAGAVLDTAAVYVAQLEVPPEVVRAAAERVRAHDGLAILNAAPFSEAAASLLEAFDVAVLNRSEAEQVTGVGVSTIEDAFAALRALRDLGVADPVVTLGAAGAVHFDRGRKAHARVPHVPVVDATGAGDAFVGALAAFLREGEDFADAVARACLYGAVATTRPGTREAYVDRKTFDAAVVRDAD